MNNDRNKGNMAVITNSAAETRVLGERLAEQLKAGDVILLEGPLGAGKSELARGIARGLGVSPVTGRSRVPSPPAKTMAFMFSLCPISFLSSLFTLLFPLATNYSLLATNN